MNYSNPCDDVVRTPEAETRPFRLALYWFTEGCVSLVERFLDRLDLYEAWLSSRNWRLFDRVARGFFAAFVCLCCCYVGFLVVAALCWVAATGGGW